MASKRMGARMLLPNPEDLERTLTESRGRAVKSKTDFKWVNQSLNEEQKTAVFNIVKGACRPLTYIVFGPPRTGKTTTVVEAVYQLAKGRGNPRILLVASSNDAADVLVEKLSPYFPPSEMRRMIAYSRTVDQLSSVAQAYASEGLSNDAICKEVMNANLVVSTINLAARFVYFGTL